MEYANITKQCLSISLELDRSESSTDGVVKKCVDSFQRIL